MKKIILIVGKTCSGKDSLVSNLSKKLGISIALSFTTRPKRTNEEEGREYNFITEEEFWELLGYNQLAEHTSYYVSSGETWYYGLTREELEKNDYVLAIVNPHGYDQIKQVYKDKAVGILIDANAKERIIRYLDRDGSCDTEKVKECCRRFLADESDFEGIEDIIERKVFNYNFEKSKKELENIIRNIIGGSIVEETNEEFKKNPMRFLK